MRTVLSVGGALLLVWAGLAEGAVVCPTCKSCSYSIRVGPIVIPTGHMNGCGTAQVDNFVSPGIPRNQHWADLHMSGDTPGLGATSVTLNPARPSDGVIQSTGGTEFPANNHISFYFRMNVSGMTLVSNDPVRLSGTIGHIPPALGTTLTMQPQDSVHFYQEGDPGQNTVATLLSSTVTISSGVLPAIGDWGIIAMFLLTLAAGLGFLLRRGRTTASA